MYRKQYLFQILFLFIRFNYSFVFTRFSRMNHLIELKNTIREDYNDSKLLTKNDIDTLVKERDSLRFNKEYTKADEIKLILEKYNIEITDVSYKNGGKSIWNYKLKKIDSIQTNLMDIAHNSYKLLEHVNEDALVTEVINIIKLQYYTQENNDIINDNIKHNPLEVMNTSIEMQGRKYADAAFEFSLSGITNQELFLLLANCSLTELQRFGYRSTCKSINILQMIEKLAVAGIRNHPIYNEAYQILQSRGIDETILLQLKPITTNTNDNNNYDNTLSSYSLFSDRPLLWLWRYASKQKKPTSNHKTINTTIHNLITDNTINNMQDTKITTTTTTTTDSTTITDTSSIEVVAQLPSFHTLFKDPNLPLIVDLGCGYGVSLLNMCDQNHKQSFYTTNNTNSTTSTTTTTTGKGNNYLGIDLNHRSISYANGISTRWGYKDTCVFQYCDCLNGLDWIYHNYPGPIVLILINFPTPYNINHVCISNKYNDILMNNTIDNNLSQHNISSSNDEILGGNSQLPDSFDNFMCSPLLIDKIYKLFSNTKKNYCNVTSSLLLQSNVEDVAVTMYNIVNYINNKYHNQEQQFHIPESPYKAYEIINNIFHINTTTSSHIINTNITTSISSPTIIGTSSTCSTSLLTNASSLSSDSYSTHWITLQQLQDSTTYGGGRRMSQRLQLWLNDIHTCSSSSSNTISSYNNSIDKYNNNLTTNIKNHHKNYDNNNTNNHQSINNYININNIIINHNNNNNEMIYPRNRAFGNGWLLNSPLPYNTRTETEVHCKLELKPIHRLLFYFN